MASIAAVQPLHVAAWIEQQALTMSAPTVKQQPIAIRHLFDCLVTGQVMPVNPAGSVRGPSYIVKRSRTPVLKPAEARALLDGINVTTRAGLCDRAFDWAGALQLRPTSAPRSARRWRTCRADPPTAGAAA